MKIVTTKITMRRYIKTIYYLFKIILKVLNFTFLLVQKETICYFFIKIYFAENVELQHPFLNHQKYLLINNDTFKKDDVFMITYLENSCITYFVKKNLD